MREATSTHQLQLLSRGSVDGWDATLLASRWTRENSTGNITGPRSAVSRAATAPYGPRTATTVAGRIVKKDTRRINGDGRKTNDCAVRTRRPNESSLLHDTSSTAHARNHPLPLCISCRCHPEHDFAFKRASAFRATAYVRCLPLVEFTRALKMEAARCFETLVNFYQTMRPYIPQDSCCKPKKQSLAVPWGTGGPSKHSSAMTGFELLYTSVFRITAVLLSVTTWTDSKHTGSLAMLTYQTYLSAAVLVLAPPRHSAHHQHTLLPWARKQRSTPWQPQTSGRYTFCALTARSRMGGRHSIGVWGTLLCNQLLTTADLPDGRLLPRNVPPENNARNPEVHLLAHSWGNPPPPAFCQFIPYAMGEGGESKDIPGTEAAS
jgi:hypothetical protein